MKQNKTMASFQFQDLEIKLHPQVYEPAEDTFLLLDGLDIKPGESVFEIGAGTGIISLYCARHGANVIASDINPFSIRLLQVNKEANKLLLEGSFQIRQGDMFEVLRPSEHVDCIIFNPPYLPTGSLEESEKLGWIDVATNGGDNGIELTLRFIKNLTSHLNPRGRAYFVVSSLGDTEKIRSALQTNNLSYEIKKQLRCDDELLEIYYITITNNPGVTS